MTPKIVIPSVMVWATVKVVTWATIGLIRVLSRKMPMTNRMWSRPLGRMWVKPSFR